MSTKPNLLEKVNETRKRSESLLQELHQKQQTVFENILASVRQLEPERELYFSMGEFNSDYVEIHDGRIQIFKGSRDFSGRTLLGDFDSASLARDPSWIRVCHILLNKIRDYLNENLRSLPKRVEREGISLATISQRMEELGEEMRELLERNSGVA